MTLKADEEGVTLENACRFSCVHVVQDRAASIYFIGFYVSSVKID